MLALLGLGLACAVAAGLGRKWAPEGDAFQRWLAAAVLLPVLGVATLRVLGGVGALAPWEILGVFALEALFAWFAIDTHWAAPSPSLSPGGGEVHLRVADPKSRIAPSPPPGERAGVRGREQVAEHPCTPLRNEQSLTLAALPPLLLTAVALAIALVAARALPIFQWDSLGYHLPFVATALQAGSLAGVPWDKPYLGTYPHAVELWDLGARALLANDRWLDAAELPLSLGAALAVAGLARRAGANPSLALGLGGLFLCLPVAFLQLPSAYIDVPAAGFFLLAVYWLLDRPSLRSCVLCGLALGLVLGAKPNAPLPVALLGGALLWRCAREGRLTWALLAAALALALGSESYVTSFIVHHNPLWPIVLSLGPLHFPGLHTIDEILQSGAAAPHLSGPLASRLARAWTAFNPTPFFDMRIGGFGPLFTYCALPLALFGALRRRGLWLLAALASLATADPAIARYTLAFPGLCLALSAAELSRLRARWQALASTGAAILAAVGLWLALPGLTVGNGSLADALKLSWQEREAALLPATGAPSWAAWRAQLPPGATVATDDSFDLMYLLWRSDLRSRVLRTPKDREGDALLDWINEHAVTFMVGSDVGATGRLAAARPDRLLALFPCGASDSICRVYAVER